MACRWIGVGRGAAARGCRGGGMKTARNACERHCEGVGGADETEGPVVGIRGWDREAPSVATMN